MRSIVIYTLILLSLLGRAQTPFSNTRECMQVSSFKTALTQMDSCIAKNYHKDSALYYKGLVYFNINRLKEAEANCSLLIKSYPAFTEAHYLNGLIAYANKDYEKSISEFNMVLSKYPNQVTALYNRSLAYGLTGNYKQCIEDLNKCTSIKPMYSQAYVSRAYWHEYSGDHTKAVKDYETGINLDPKNFEAYFSLAEIYRKQKEKEKSCEILARAIKSGSQMAEELNMLFCK